MKKIYLPEHAYDILIGGAQLLDLLIALFIELLAGVVFGLICTVIVIGTMMLVL